MSEGVDLSQVEEGFKTPGVICKHCKAPLAVINDPTSIPEVFRIRCPKCTHDDAYRKSEVTAVEVRRKATDQPPS